MTDTYSKDAPYQEKISEELRLIRCLLERFMRAHPDFDFPDYQLEKFRVLDRLAEGEKNVAEGILEKKS